MFFVLPCVPPPSPCPRKQSHAILLSIPTPALQHTFPQYMCRSLLCILVGPSPDSIDLKVTANFVFHSDRHSFPFAWTLAHFNRFQIVIAAHSPPGAQFLEDVSSPSDIGMTPHLKGSISTMLYPTQKTVDSPLCSIKSYHGPCVIVSDDPANKQCISSGIVNW